MNHIKKIIIPIIIFVAIIIGLIWEDNSLAITNIRYSNSKIPDEFNGYKIVQISDLHGKEFGKNQNRLISKIEKCNPDIIVITGDLVDARIDSLDTSMEFVNRAIKIAPVYYVAGNHEASSGKYNEVKQKLIEANVIVLDNAEAKITKNGQSISIFGVLDPYFYNNNITNFYYYHEDSNDAIQENSILKGLVSDDNSFKILLSHRPELMDVYAENGIDLVFAGHAHGGQIRIPFVGAIVAPNQGFFPKYTSGANVQDNITMVVSRGLGNSRFPLRVFNRPEIVVVELERN